MNIRENIREGLKSINGNRLRTVLTALIIAVGITSLVGILTAIDGIQASVDSSFNDLGANTFNVRTLRTQGRRTEGVIERNYPPINYREVRLFMDNYKFPSTPSVSAGVTGNAEIKYKSKVTNPNSFVNGVDMNFLIVEGYTLAQGRNFSQVEDQNAARVVIIGYEIYETLFEGRNPINEDILFLGGKFRVIGVLEKQGGVGGASGADRIAMIPVETARIFSSNRELRYELTVALDDPTNIKRAMGEAIGVMRKIRRDPLGQPESFEAVQSTTLAERLQNITGYLRIGGFTIGFITLIGASIGLMNIMLVSVTERTREIGLRKALGATPQKIRQQFLIEALVITQLGGIGGVVMGLVIGNLISRLLSSSGFVVPWLWILLGLVVGMTVGLLSGYIPAYKASRLDPIESLRHE
ncbi:MAG: ABC transporter permease [Bacteroidetes bacterium]|nr:ABC transporter permease [Bacteroidota bacterium]MDA1120123.1 ABC transporter permease [Bacteroidota bacterium]